MLCLDWTGLEEWMDGQVGSVKTKKYEFVVNVLLLKAGTREDRDK